MSVKEMNKIEFSGCTEEPLISYLKGLGIFTIVSKQKDRNVKGYWKNGRFCLKTHLTAEELEQFFMDEYAPVPLFGPWGTRSGIWDNSNEKGSRESLNKILLNSDKRFDNFRRVYEDIIDFNSRYKIEEKPKDLAKREYIIKLRSQMEADFRDWIDTNYVLNNIAVKEMLLLGTGGNEGSGSYFKSYLHSLEACFNGTLEGKKLPANPKDYLFDSFNGTDTCKKININCGQLNPTSTNTELNNPWDLIFSLEGILLFAGSAVKRYNVDGDFSFPFIVKPSVSGFGHSCENKISEFEAEFWLPIWSSPSRFGEIEYLFNEGKASFGNKNAKNGLSFALAVSSFGVDKGISSFNRYGRMKRNGQNNIALPLGRFKVHRVKNIDLISDFSNWLTILQSIANRDKVPEKYRKHRRNIEDSIFSFTKYGGSKNLQNILINLGETEYTFAKTRSSSLIRPLPRLSPRWIRECDDGSAEYSVACGLASIYDKNIGHIRDQLEAVWSQPNVSRSIAWIMKRRFIEKSKNGNGNPLSSRISVPLDDVQLFIEGKLNDKKVMQLLCGLSLMDWSKYDHKEHALKRRRKEVNKSYSFNAYALLKLVFPDGVYVRKDGNLRASSNPEDVNQGVRINGDVEILSLFMERPERAIDVAIRRLRIHGMIPFGTTKGRGSNLDFNLDAKLRERILAALMIPIWDYEGLAKTVLRDNKQ